MIQQPENSKEEDDPDDSFEEILPENEEEDYEIITGLREKIVRINSLSIEKSHVKILDFFAKTLFFSNFFFIKSWLTCGTSRGFRVYLLKDLKFFFKCEGSDFVFESGVSEIQALYCSFVFALIPDGLNKRFSDTKVYFWDQKQRKILKEIECYNIISQFELFRAFLLVQSEGKFPRISLINIANLTISKIFLLNPVISPRFFSMNSDETKPILAFLRLSASVLLYNFLADFEYFLESKYEEIQTLTLNSKGDRLAVSNKEGSYISIYSLPERQVHVELYRGRNACRIKQMNFSKNGRYFFVHSDRETLHIYDIERKNVNFSLIPVGIIAMIQGKYLSSFAKYYINTQKFAKIYEKQAFLNEKGGFYNSKIVEGEEGELLIVKDNGDLEKMSFDQEKGGWGEKIGEREFFDGWDLIEENVKALVKCLGASFARKIMFFKKKNN